jgi:flagellar hook assembly protein FlgD
MASISIKNGEGKWIKFTITNSGVAVDVSTWTFRLGIKKNINDASYKIEKTNVDFDVTQANLGIVRVNLTTAETSATLLPSGSYIGELESTTTLLTDVDKSVSFDLIVEKAVLA